jgi:quinoprotein glucose dehydrogenase
MTEDDLADFSPGAHDSLVKVFRSLRYEGLFTPPSIKGSLNLPGTIGGSEWGGAAYDPAARVLYLKANNSPEIDQLRKITPGTSDAVTPLHTGRTIYMSYCAGCHKPDRSGDEPLYPTLIGLGKRMTPEQVIGKIRQGGGKMPPFEGVIKGKEKAILTYLFSGDDRKAMQQESDLREIRNNRASTAGAADTASAYLNVLAYAPFRGAGDYPAIKPPWGVLNAIDLSTGEYLWRVPCLTGSPGPMVTAGGLVFIAGGKDRKFSAFDKENGKLLWEVELPAMGSSTPCTYMWEGRQYIVLAVAGDKVNPAGRVMAFALP